MEACRYFATAAVTILPSERKVATNVLVKARNGAPMLLGSLNIEVYAVEVMC
jgi:hypothetical protein